MNVRQSYVRLRSQELSYLTVDNGSTHILCFQSNSNVEIRKETKTDFDSEQLFSPVFRMHVLGHAKTNSVYQIGLNFAEIYFFAAFHSRVYCAFLCGSNVLLFVSLVISAFISLEDIIWLESLKPS